MLHHARGTANRAAAEQRTLTKLATKPTTKLAMKLANRYNRSREALAYLQEEG